jgi:hypothetical protein
MTIFSKINGLGDPALSCLCVLFPIGVAGNLQNQKPISNRKSTTRPFRVVETGARMNDVLNVGLNGDVLKELRPVRQLHYGLAQMTADAGACDRHAKHVVVAAGECTASVRADREERRLPVTTRRRLTDPQQAAEPISRPMSIARFPT